MREEEEGVIATALHHFLLRELSLSLSPPLSPRSVEDSASPSVACFVYLSSLSLSLADEHVPSCPPCGERACVRALAFERARGKKEFIREEEKKSVIRDGLFAASSRRGGQAPRL